jgi:hypothetical protein
MDRTFENERGLPFVQTRVTKTSEPSQQPPPAWKIILNMIGLMGFPSDSNDTNAIIGSSHNSSLNVD